MSTTIATRRSVRGKAVGLVFLGSLFACSDVNSPDPVLAPREARFGITMTNCGASYTVITNEMDSLMARHGIPATQDTTAVCETWNGADYVTQAATLGSSENAVSVPDTVQSVTYSSGYVTAEASNGAAVGSPSNVGATLFDLMSADAAQRQAAYDNPYYGVYAPQSCITFTCPIVAQSRTGSKTAEGGASAASTLTPAKADFLSASRAALGAAASPDTTKFRRHGLHRAGVRALVDSMEEVARAPNGGRRFRGVRDGDELILTVDDVRELLIGEETHFRDGRVSRTVHRWRRIPSGYLRTHTDIEDEETIRGTRYHNRVAIDVSGLRINGVVIDASEVTP